MDDTPVWERSKENTAPLERGRNIQLLEKSFLLNSTERRPENDQMVERYEKLVRPTESTTFQLVSEDDDPLLHWLSYIKFYQDTYPSDTHSQFLLFERCMRSLYRFNKYANDTRFVRICCRYAGQTERSCEVFQHLYQQNIGLELAMFWIAWSFVCEKQEDYQFAKKILEKGMRKRAKPVNKLEARYKQFQRRMASHWLNATQQGDDHADIEDEEQPSRAILSALSEDAVRRNDRRVRQEQQHRGRPLFPQTMLADTSNTRSRAENGNIENRAGNNEQNFSIFVEDSENRPTDQSLLLNESSFFPLDRPIEREEDRKKENTMERQRWNERGAYVSAYDVQQHIRSRPAAQPLPPFAIHVDEKCAEEHARQEAEEAQAQKEMRRRRDERTFRERERAGMVEKLQEDPLLYIRDPSRFEEDQAAEENERSSRIEREPSRMGGASHPKKESRKVRKRTNGYQHKLLKSAVGHEQCFEEARARAKFYTLVDASANFHNLRSRYTMPIANPPSMEIEESDVSMAEDNPKRPPRLESVELYTRNFIVPPTPTPRNASTASSTVDESACVGVPEGRIEQTINTQMAIRELSMMFSSPAIDSNPSKTPAKRSGGLGHLLNMSALSHGDPMPSIVEKSDDDAFENPTFEELGEIVAGAADSSFARVPGSPKINGNLLGTKKKSNNSQPFSIYNDEGLDTDINAEAKSSGNSQRSKSKEELNAAESFTIYNDDVEQETDTSAGKQANTASAGPSFNIFNDEEGETLPAKNSYTYAKTEGSKDRFSVQKEKQGETSRARNVKKPKTLNVAQPFSIYNDDDEHDAALGSQGERSQGISDKMRDVSVSEDKGQNGKYKNRSPRENYIPLDKLEGEGDTATFSLFGSEFSELAAKDGEGETASLGSLVEELHRNEKNDLKRARSESDDEESPSFVCSTFGVFKEDSTGQGGSSEPLRHSVDVPSSIATSYPEQHKEDVRNALERLSNRSLTFPKNKKSLFSILTEEDKVFHLAEHVVPRCLRLGRKSLKIGHNEDIWVSKSSAVLKRELGRGAYGVVALLQNPQGSSSNENVALKAQSPPDCLAWEYEVLQILRKRLKNKPINEVPFPTPLSYLGLEDGALFTMSAASESGLTLLDLVNNYKSADHLGGDTMPEVLAMHYTARMLHHIELLHSRGRILHCDIKPDNWVLTASDIVGGESLEAADIHLVDFGRAVDLESVSGQANSLDQKFTGKATRDDMLCVAMRMNPPIPWSFDVDTFGICDTSHVMLFGEHMQLDEERWMPKKRLQRYHQRSLWTKVFETLLKIEEGSNTAIGSRPLSVKQLRETLEDYLSSKTSILQSALKHQATFLWSNRPSHR
ncbi:hypothetical protein ACA910_018197 [Epithemia clementina (nom. ined.)]